MALDVSTDQREIQLICLHEIGEKEEMLSQLLTLVIVAVYIKMFSLFEYVDCL